MHVTREDARGRFGGCGGREGAREVDAAVIASAGADETEPGREVPQREEDGVFVECADVVGGVGVEGGGGRVREEGREVRVRFCFGGNEGAAAARWWEVIPAGGAFCEPAGLAGTERTGMWWVCGHATSGMAEVVVVTREHLERASQRWWRRHYGILTGWEQRLGHSEQRAAYSFGPITVREDVKTLAHWS